MLSKQFDCLKFKNIYTELISLSKIKLLQYFDKFENILLNINITYPTSAKFIYFLANGPDIPQKGYSFNV